ncbi:hypothetical protein BOTBODRAFT_56383 [Botryobasidium botryosum FD-172 SS1]|uniref:Uncharacterized protein n=1 Tax=Botryobasidium botryosum (strain FD-172 SS1) TaxID=930990 RepID=A0A067MBZ6_BOTB1|nr:hypothetical protein BOTBODRAFT_56383 [Botryobasidium botryosum FD-172 SS1]
MGGSWTIYGAPADERIVALCGGGWRCHQWEDFGCRLRYRECRILGVGCKRALGNSEAPTYENQAGFVDSLGQGVNMKEARYAQSAVARRSCSPHRFLFLFANAFLPASNAFPPIISLITLDMSLFVLDVTGADLAKITDATLIALFSDMGRSDFFGFLANCSPSNVSLRRRGEVRRASRRSWIAAE